MVTLLLEQPETTPADTAPGRATAPNQRSPSYRGALAPFRWVAAHRVMHRQVAESVTVYDCVRFVFVCDGSIVLRGDAEPRPVSSGDVVLVTTGVAFGWEPEGRTVVTTVPLDTGYLLGVFFWQHLEHAADLADAAELAARMYPDPIQVLRLGEPAVERLGPVLDDLTALTAELPEAAGFFRLQSLVDEVLSAIAPHIRTAPGVQWPVSLGPRARVPR
ncbi:hypothetical protein [Leucobacter sp. wl10]|uniref:hypothetical protein n=1 Tax=Leucobacter sp. wl10 TaxID=2304677 RepID=UPI0013C35689|nr:hypothetical protein [Leucobacter sp. wl10]